MVVNSITEQKGSSERGGIAKINEEPRIVY
jgi:hypothetical protein